MNEWLLDHPWIAFAMIYAGLVFIYNKVFRVRKLPLLKDLIVYLLVALGAGMLLIFQLDAGLPIIPCLAVAIGLMFIVRIRYFMEARQKARQQKKQG
ncbi:YlaH-like family protein [Paenibacillus gansuensis]|uniref:YlaH-like family protein n=1 Tax=Paenibacillus gansuensis TaxID=306542 RepID=A0ABW5PBQ8_9BACL